jgi:alpha-ketoglutarate-dependent 2,4-dichlorophenoxyacetate dioxygenase
VPITIRPLHPFIGGEVSGLDIARPLSAEDAAAIHAGMDRYAVLVFHDQDISDEQQLAFTRALGPIELMVGGHITKPEDSRLGPYFADVSNLDRAGDKLARADRRRLFNLGNRLWHSDSSFRATPAKYSLLSARSVPSAGGNTEFADMRAAYDALDEETKAEIDGLICEHSLIHSRGALGFTELSEDERREFAPVRQRLVRRHPLTGRKSLYLSSHAGAIVGWPVPEARFLLRDLTEHATQRQFVYAHRWRLHDFVMWDNRQTMHRVRPFRDTAEVRDMRRTTIVGDGPTVEQVELARIG